MKDGNAYNIAAIPTTYKGVRFRSRLEAKWAVFFDLVQWPWTYEPFDMNGWIPDFALHFYKPVLVEVKPYVQTADYYALAESLETYAPDLELLVLGASLITGQFQNAPAVGVIGEPMEKARLWSPALLDLCAKCFQVSMISEGGSFTCRKSGCYDGDHYVSFPEELPYMAAWWFAQASNAVQWRKGA